MPEVPQIDWDSIPNIPSPGLEHLTGPITLTQKGYVKDLCTKLGIEQPNMTDWSKSKASRIIDNMKFEWDKKILQMKGHRLN